MLARLCKLIPPHLVFTLARKYGTNQPFVEIIKKQIPEMPTNVRLIEPHEKVNSWSIMQISDLGIVHTSTVGIEMLLENIPCMTVSKTHFRDRGFTIDVETSDGYFEVINHWDREKRSLDLKAAKDYARRYAYLLFERYQLPFSFFYEPNHTDVRAMNFESAGGLADHAVMRLIIDSIENKKEFLLPNDPLGMGKYSGE